MFEALKKKLGLGKIKKQEELPETGATTVRVDWADAGLGSGSCGPMLLPEYRLTGPEVRFSLVLSPFI